MESLPDGRDFCTAEEAARAAGKPVIVARTGRSPAGVRAAQSHTAALAGSERIWRAALEQAGVLMARSGLEMLDAARALDSQPLPTGNRIAIITNSGGTGVELADLLADEGLAVPELSTTLQDELRPLLPPLASLVNPVDVTPVWRRFAELYPDLVDRLARSDEVDVVIPSCCSERPPIRPSRWACATRWPGFAALGWPCRLEWPERTARAVGHAVHFARGRHSEPFGGTQILEPDLGARMLCGAGIGVVEAISCLDVAETVDAAERLGYPVVCKVVHPDLPHRSDVGGVRLGLRDPDAMQTAARALFGLATGARVRVQPQIDGVEVAVGGLRDPQFGPVVMIGLGGILVEVMDDVAFGLAPLSTGDAHRLIASLRGYAVLTGARGREPVDLGALAGMVSAVGDLLATRPEIVELDLNPLLATPRGAVTVDWHITVQAYGTESVLSGRAHASRFGPRSRSIARR